VAGHRYVTLGTFLIERRDEFAAIENPALKLRDCAALWRAAFDLIEERTDSIPVAQVNVLRHKTARGVRRQILEWQQTHWRQHGGEAQREKAKT
jgi:hypothetical protein